MVPQLSYQQNPPAALAPRVLVVDDEKDLLDLISDVVSRRVNARMLSARNIKDAERILKTETVDLLVTDVCLPDGDGMKLLNSLQKHHPQASAMVITGHPSMDGAITAIREGACDFVPKPFTADDLTERVRKALERHAQVVKREKRLDKLRDAVKRLNEARKVVSKKVDLLCHDLITAYGELSKQLDSVRTQEGFRNFLGQSRDLEQLLCHAMDWMLRQLGYTNIAIWLAADEKDFQLGAYMKYTIAGEVSLTNAMRHGIVPMVMRDGFVHLRQDELKQKLTPAEYEYLFDQDILAVNCTYLGEPLAAVVLFRDKGRGFSADEEACLKTISPLFAVALASVVRGTTNTSDGNVIDPEDPPKKDNDDEWWKRGEAPPF